MGVVVDLAGHLFLGATISSVGEEILESGSPFPEILGSSSDFLGATELASNEADLGGLAFL